MSLKVAPLAKMLYRQLQKISGRRKQSESSLTDVIPTVQERKEWLQLAFNPDNVVAVYFDADKDQCESRINTRYDHPTIRAGGGRKALDQFSKSMEPPQLSEGFAAIYYVTTFEESQALIRKWTGNTPSTTANFIYKFPRTPHLFNWQGFCKLGW